MKLLARTPLTFVVWTASLLLSQAQEADRSPAEIFAAAFQKVVAILEPAAGAPAQTLSTRLRVVKAEGLPKELAEQSAELAFQAPDRVQFAARVQSRQLRVGRNQQQLWIHAPDKHFGVVGQPGLVRFQSSPDKRDTTRLGRLKLPVAREQLALLPLLMSVEARPAETVGGARCQVLRVTPKPEARDAFKLPGGQLTLWVRERDSLPARVGYRDGKQLDVEVEFQDLKLGDPWPDGKWDLQAQEGDKVQKVALSHLTRFLPVAVSLLTQKIPTLGPATGERRVVATEGEGRIEQIDGTRVLFVKGTPEDMGRQQGTLLKKQVGDLVDHILYGVGVGSSFEKGRWFFAEIEEAQSRLAPFIDERYLREMDAMALASGRDREEVRLANFFPELFHCSGFALYGEATDGGRIFHGRILDYLKGVGLEQNAVVMVVQPDRGHAWVNISYAGFVGTVTAMNEKQVAIGEMGGRGEGHWDGKPMAQLLREVMEKAGTLDEAVDIMRKGPRTCEYYYVISDGKTKRAVGIAATPDTFETVWAGQSHPRLPHPIKDAVLMSAGDRYLKLVERVKAGHGKFDAEAARDLMRRPVAMNSNIHSVLFAPDTLDFWVANADSKNVASHTRYTHYNLGELLKGPPVAAAAAGAGN
jgi:outer membrane lipoprotein-sorting protein